MGTTWAERYVDRTLERRWLDLRVELADRLAAGLDGAWDRPITFERTDGEVLDVDIFDEAIVLGHGDLPEAYDNVDEAAHRAYEILHQEWAVIDPAFLTSELTETPPEADGGATVVVPALGKAQSREQLQAWVEATFQADLDGPLAVGSNGDLPWTGPNGARVVVSVRNQYFVEVWAILAERVSFKKAHRVIDQLDRKHPAVRFHLDQDTLVMSRVLDASPFVPEHLTDALSLHLELAGELSWVRPKVLRKRARTEQEATVPRELVAVLPTAYRVSLARLVAVLGEAAGDTSTLRTWLEVARRERRAARDLPRGEDDVHGMGRRARWAWLRVERALTQAITVQEQEEK